MDTSSQPAARPSLAPEPLELSALRAALPGRVADDPDALAAIHAAVQAAVALEAAHRAEETVENYEYSWNRWVDWCDQLDLVPLPALPNAIAVYVGHLSITGGSGDGQGCKATTIATYLSGITAAHTDRGLPDPVQDPVVQRVLRGLRRTKGIRPNQVCAMSLPELFAVVDTIDARRLIALRDHVIIAADATVTDVGRIRPSQLARLGWEHIRLHDDAAELGLTTPGRGSDRQTVRVQERADALCLVRALRALHDHVVERCGHAGSPPGVHPMPSAQRSAWLAAYDVTDGRVAAGPVMLATTRHGTIRSGRAHGAGRAAVTTRLTRAAGLVGVAVRRQSLPRWNDRQRRRAVAAVLRPPLADIRDRALLLMGFALAARRSNLTILLASEIAAVERGLRVHFRWSKTDQDGVGRDLAVPAYGGPYCPVAAWHDWLAAMTDALGGEPGDDHPAFPPLNPAGDRIADPRPIHIVRNDSDSEISHWEGICGDEINNIVKRRAKAAGLHRDPATGAARRWGGHSLRRGWLTEAARQRLELNAMMSHAGHAHPATALGYIEEAQLFDFEHSAAMQLQFTAPDALRLTS